MKLSKSKLFTAFLALAAAAPASSAQVNATASATRTASAVPAAGSSPVSIESIPGLDPDQGDEHASQRAIDVVCTKDTPAAQHAAICNGPLSRG